jgi:hypothetical protein
MFQNIFLLDHDGRPAPDRGVFVRVVRVGLEE